MTVLTPEEVDALPYRHTRVDGVQEVFKGFDESSPLVAYDSLGIPYLINEWSDGKRFKERF